MKFLLAVLLSATIFQVILSEKVKKCPGGYELFHRTPTDRNNHTSQYCLRIVKYNETFNHDTAMFLCSLYQGSLTIVENQKELDHVNAQLRAEVELRKHTLPENATLRLTIDGVFNPQCKDYSRERSRKTGGFCELDKSLFLFQDFNTDPAFILTKFRRPKLVPYHYSSAVFRVTGSSWQRYAKRISECLSLNGNYTQVNNVDNVDCRDDDDSVFLGALCGTHPA